MNTENVTLAIPCYNVSATIRGCLRAVTQLDPEPARVICIDDGCSDGSAEIIREFDSVELVEHGENRGLASARNTALEEAQTEYLAMIDADIHPKSDWLGGLCDEMSDSPAAVVAGRVVEMTSTKADQWRSIHLSQDHGTEPHTGEPVPGANGLFHVPTLEEIGGWNPKYRTNYEDIDLCQRLLDSGYEIRYEPGWEVEHHRTDTPQSILSTTWNHHFKLIDQPTSVFDIPRRIGRHMKEAGLDLKRDIETGNYHLASITLRRPVAHLREDITTIRQNRRANS